MTNFQPEVVGPHLYHDCFVVVERDGRYEFELDEAKTLNGLDVVDQRGGFDSASDASNAAFEALEKIEWDLIVENAQGAGFRDFLVGDDLGWARLGEDTLQIIIMANGKHSIYALPVDQTTILKDGDKAPAWSSVSDEFVVELSNDRDELQRVTGSRADFKLIDSVDYDSEMASVNAVFGGRLASFRKAMQMAMEVEVSPSTSISA